MHNQGEYMQKILDEGRLDEERDSSDPLKWLLRQPMQYFDIPSSPRSSDSQLTTGPADP